MAREEIQHDTENTRFTLTFDGEEAVLSYRKEGELLDIYSTYTPEAIRGKGIAGKLVEEALEYARKNGYKVQPTCPYVATYMKRHEEHQDLKA